MSNGTDRPFRLSQWHWYGLTFFTAGIVAVVLIACGLPTWPTVQGAGMIATMVCISIFLVKYADPCPSDPAAAEEWLKDQKRW